MRPGVIDLRDLLGTQGARRGRGAAFAAHAGLGAVDAAGARRQRFAPPRVLVAIVPRHTPGYLWRHQRWLRRAAHLIVVVDHLDPGEDASIGAQVTWPRALAALPGATCFDWTTDPASGRAAIARARELAAALAPGAEAPPPGIPDRELPTGPWIAVDDPWILRSVLVAGFDGAHARLRTADGGWLDLAAPPPSAVLVSPIAQGPDHRVSDLGRDPVHATAWRKHDRGLQWHDLTSGEPELLLIDEADDPYEHVHSYRDDVGARRPNYPIQVCLAPDLRAVVSRFDHDVVVTTAVPLAWQAVGAVDVAVFRLDPHHAVLYAGLEWPHHPRPGDGVELDRDDTREHGPAVVLGPDAAHHYAVALDHEVVRVGRSPTTGQPIATVVGGPGGGYAIFDAEHRLVRRATGRLLGGWYRHATIEADGAYWREDLVTGARRRLAPADLRVCADPAAEQIARDAHLAGRHDDAARIRDAEPTTERPPSPGPEVLAIPGTRNLLLCRRGWIRVI